MSENKIRQIPLTSLFIAFGVVIPQFFHLFGLGSTFLPMFIPVMIGSMFLTFQFAAILGILTPIISWFITGMPPVVPPILPIMIIELLGVSLSISFIKVHLKKSFWLAMFTAIIIDRIILFFIVSAVAPLFELNHPIFSLAIVAGGLPGILLQIILIPIVMRLLEKKTNLFLERVD